MKAKDIVVGGKYTARVSGKLVTVLVQPSATAVQPQWQDSTTCYDVTNLTTGREVDLPHRRPNSVASPAIPAGPSRGG